MVLVIAEKPSVGRSLASFLGSEEKSEGYISGPRYTVSWGFGHLVNLADPQEYGKGWEKWNIESLPLIPDNFLYGPNPEGKKQLATLKKLIQASEEIINATDAGREGELIFRLIYEFIGIRKPVTRLWVSNTTEAGLKEAFGSMQPSSRYDNLFYSARSRQIADWLVGINATRALSLTVNIGKVLSIGRVQTPVLALICNRFLAHSNFVVTSKYNLKADFLSSDTAFSAISEIGLETFYQAQEVIGNHLNGPWIVKVADKEKEITKPPLLFDLSAAQQFANKHHGYTAEASLKLLQELYEKGLLTYPRTDSKYLNSTMIPLVSDVLSSLKEQGLVPDGLNFKENPKAFNDEKVSDHHAIIPTGRPTNGLSGELKTMFEMVTSRFMAVFFEDILREKFKVTIICNGYEFKVTGVKVLIPGWGLAEPISLPKAVAIPELKAGQSLIPSVVVPHEVKTKAPELYTDGTIIKAMENAGKDVDDEEASEVLKDRGIGTPATRDSIIELLIKRTYVIRKNKSLVPTELGLSVYELVKEMAVASPDLTGEWELKLKRINDGQYKEQLFQEEIKGYSSELVKELLSIDAQGIHDNAKRDETLCPKCGKGTVREGDKSYYCSSFKGTDGCKFTIWKTIAGKKIPKSAITCLLSGKRTKLIEGFTSKSEKPFNAHLQLNPDSMAVEFSFENR